MNAVFLDKDGTLIEDLPYNVDPRRISLAPGAAAGLPLLQQAGYALIVVSNQAGVARGLFPEAALAAVEERLQVLLAELGVRLTGFLYCPHHPQGSAPGYAVDCQCRKPAPGMLLQAAQRYRLDLQRCWMVGDILNDIEAGRRAGCKTVLIDNGNETEWVLNRQRLPQHVVTDLSQAARVILAVDGGPGRAEERLWQQGASPLLRS